MKKKHWFLRVFLTLLALLILLPLVLTLVYSFCSPAEMKAFMKTRNQYGGVLMELKLRPDSFSLDQYWNVLIQDTSILRYYFNSIGYTAATLAGQAVVIPMLAYALSRFEFRGRDVIAFSIIVLLLLPFQVTMVPTVLTLRAMGLMDTMWAIILPSLASPFYVFLLRQSMVASRVSCSRRRRSTVQAQRGAMSTSRCRCHEPSSVRRRRCPSQIAGTWWSSRWCSCPAEMTCTPLSVVFNQLSQESTGVEFAGAALYLLPALLMYLYFQNDIMTGIQLSEMK